jgi:hypothetical protein
MTRPETVALDLAAADADRVADGYLRLRRWWRVLRRSLRCFFFAMRLRRFLMTEPIYVPRLDRRTAPAAVRTGGNNAATVYPQVSGGLRDRVLGPLLLQS